MSDMFVKSKEVLRVCGGISDVTLARWIRDGKFPLPCMVVNRVRYWKKSDVVQWQDGQK